MFEVEVKRALDDDDVAAVQDLLDVAWRVDGHHAVDEHRWLDLVHGGRAAYTGLVASEANHDHPVGYAQLSRNDHSWQLDVVVDPHHRQPGLPIGVALAREAAAVVAEAGGGHFHLWVSGPTPDHDRIAAAIGLVRGRDLYQMRRPLPLGEPATVTTRPFVVGRDEEAWLEVNNRAFSWHPEQGGWELATLKEREAEPWFDPDGFLLHEHDGRLAGFCWTKVHPDAVGEIYVIAVDPDFAGRGLGRQLVAAGLQHLHDVRGCTTGMLYVDAGNTDAVGLYVKMGFTVDHVNRAYVGDIAAA